MYVVYNYDNIFDVTKPKKANVNGPKGLNDINNLVLPEKRLRRSEGENMIRAMSMSQRIDNS